MEDVLPSLFLVVLVDIAGFCLIKFITFPQKNKNSPIWTRYFFSSKIPLYP